MLNQNEKNPANQFEIKKVDQLFGSDFTNTKDEVQEKNSENETMEVDIDILQEFKNHPFKVEDDERMQELVDSIKENGIIYPILCRTIPTGGLEIIAGHRRTHAAKLAGLTKVPAIIKNDLSDEDASIIMVDSNIQREKILPSEKAKAYRIKMDAMNRKGQRSDKKINTAKEIGELGGDSARQVNRYIRLSYLIPELLELVDQKKISAFTTGLSLAYLKESEQIFLYKLYTELSLLPNAKQAEAIKKMSAEYAEEDKELTEANIKSVFAAPERVKEDKKITIKKSDVEKFFPPETKEDEMKSVIYKLLQDWSKSNN